MRVSLNWIKKYVDLPKDLTPSQIAYDLTLRTVEVESVENTSDKENKSADIIVKVPGDDIVVKKTAKSFEEAVDLAGDAAERLLIKRKEKMKSH